MEKDIDTSLIGYPSDLTDAEWEIISLILEENEPYKIGRPRKIDLRKVVNAIYYLEKTGCPWRYLPNDFPQYQTVNYYYNKWTDNGTFEKINTALDREFRLVKKPKSRPIRRRPR